MSGIVGSTVVFHAITTCNACKQKHLLQLSLGVIEVMGISLLLFYLEPSKKFIESPSGNR